jgi:hypothetical protein
MRYNEKRTYLLVDFPISVDGNVVKNEAQKTVKYIELTTEI